MNPFSAFTSKIFGSIAIGLLIVVALMYWRISSLNATIEAQRTALAECNAARAVQNVAIRAAADEGERQRQAYAQAVEAGQQTIREAQPRVTVVRQTARNTCDTPPQIMGAGL